jgi:hypothetical protein
MFDVFYERGQQLSLARAVMDNDKDTISALALVSIHSAIAFNDALHIRLTGKRSKSENHNTAADATARQCRSRNLNVNGITQLKRLISNKTPYSYGDRKVTPEQAQAASVAAERFEAWVNQTLKEL